jgi:hypothetical protein
MRLRRDFGADRVKPRGKPFADGDPVRIDVLASVERADQPTQLTLGFPLAAANGGGGDPPLAARGIGTKRIT